MTVALALVLLAGPVFVIRLASQLVARWRGGSSMNGYLLPNDAGWTEEKALLADLSHLNAEITRYVLRQLDVDTGRVEPISSNDVQALGRRLVELGERVQRRTPTANSTPVIEGEATQRRVLEPGSERGMEDGL